MKLRISQGQAIRSVFGRSRVTHFIAVSFLCGFAAAEQGALAVLVEAVEQRSRKRKQLLVVADHREASQQDIETGSLGGVVALVGEVGLVHDLRDLPQNRVGKLVVVQEGLEA